MSDDKVASYKYIEVYQNGEIEGKSCYHVLNKKSGDRLAIIHWYPDWNDWVFTQANRGIVFNDSCLEDIIDFIETLEE